MAATKGRGIKPAHPGEVLRDIWGDIGLTQEQFAGALGVARQTVAQLLARDRNISADMAHRLAKALGTSPRMWMRLQEAFDLWEAEKKHRRQYAKIAMLTAARIPSDGERSAPVRRR